MAHQQQCKHDNKERIANYNKKASTYRSLKGTVTTVRVNVSIRERKMVWGKKILDIIHELLGAKKYNMAPLKLKCVISAQRLAPD